MYIYLILTYFEYIRTYIYINVHVCMCIELGAFEIQITRFDKLSRQAPRKSRVRLQARTQYR